MATTSQSSALPQPAAVPLRLVCSEIWGGNRMIDAPVDLPGLRGRIYSRPSAGGRGGDVHYLAVCGAGLLARLWVGDVVGHGEAVARISGEIHKLLERYMSQPDQRRMLGDFNKRLQTMGFDAITTAAVATYYSLARRLSVSYAGHPPGWYYERATRRWTRLTVDAQRPVSGVPADCPLAVDPNAVFNRRERAVSVGDRLLLLTDGVLEAPRGDGEMFGRERLLGLLQEHRDASAADVAEGVLDGLVAFAGQTGLAHDDVTLLVVEFVPGPRGPAMWHMVKNMVLRPRGNSDDIAFADQRQPPAA